MRWSLSIRKTVVWLGLYSIIGLTSLLDPAYGQGFHSSLSPNESQYWHFIERQWNALHEAEFVINSPMRSTNLRS